MKYLFSLLLVTFSCVVTAQQVLPENNSTSLIYAGNARFTVITPSMIRMEWSKDKKFTDASSQVFLDRKIRSTDFKKDLFNDSLIITTSKLVLKYIISSDSFSINNIKINSVAGLPFEWRPGIIDSGNLKGTMRTLDGKDGGDLAMLEQGLLSKNGWVLINDSKSYLLDNNNWVADRSDTTSQDWYFLGYGYDYKKALLDFTNIAGKIPLPPRFAFGYWWSRYWIYGETEIKELVNNFKELDIPVDVVIIDMDWHETYGFRGNATVSDGQGSIVGWTGYTWNKNIFPEPKKLLQWMEGRSIKTALNLHPAAGIPPMEEKYKSFAKAYSFDTTGNRYIPYYGSDKKWADIYFDSVLTPLEKMGVDFWWLDWQQYPFDRLKTSLSNTWWLNHLFFTKMQQTKRRPLLFHRWGGLGNHRYQVGFSGDTYTTWKALAFQPAFTATAANVGYGYWSHDIGGHQISAEHPADIKDGELFLRWMQFGVFSPVLRTHSTKKAEIDRRFWNFKNEYQDIVDLVKLRYQLNPYIYTASRNAYDSGISLCHPLYYEHPETAEGYQFSNQYYFGKQMIVAPVVSKTDSSGYLSKIKIWLPPGEWEEWFTGNKLSGNKIYERNYSKTEIPVFVKAGSVIPLFPDNIKNLQQLSDTVILQVFRGNGGGNLYEDDGDTEGYKKGQFVSTVFEQRASATQSEIVISPSRGNYPGRKKNRSWVIKLNKTFPPSSVEVDGKIYSYSEVQKTGTWTYSGDLLETIISLPPATTSKSCIIKIYNAAEQEANAHLLEGYRSFVNRMKFAMERIKFEISAVDWGAAIPDPILHVESLPVRIDYHPTKAIQYLRENELNKNKLRAVIMSISDVPKDKLRNICDFLQLK